MDLNEKEISKVLGRTVRIKTKLNDEFVGIIYSLIKSSNLLVLLSKDLNDQSAINSLIINLNHIVEINLNESAEQVT